MIFSAKFSSVTAMASGTLEILLDRRNRWQQSISLELFNGVKDIFSNCLPVEATRKQNFVLEQGASTSDLFLRVLAKSRFFRVLFPNRIRFNKVYFQGNKDRNL